MTNLQKLQMQDVLVGLLDAAQTWKVLQESDARRSNNLANTLLVAEVGIAGGVTRVARTSIIVLGCDFT